MANTFTDGYKYSQANLPGLQAAKIVGMSDEDTVAHKAAIEKAQNPIGNFGRLLSTYNLKGGALAGLTYGAFVFGLGPVGLALAGAASFMFSKFAATHYAAYKQVAESNKFSQLEGSYFEMAKTASKNVGQFLANSTYRSAVLSMNESAIAKTSDDASFYQLGTTEAEANGFDKESLGIDLIAGLASVLALAYAPISSPLALLATATLPVLTASKAYGYVSTYLNTKTPVGGTNADVSGKTNSAKELAGGGALLQTGNELAGREDALRQSKDSIQSQGPEDDQSDEEVDLSAEASTTFGGRGIGNE
jgi:hypothetical protein